jgi:peroxiredoxin
MEQTDDYVNEVKKFIAENKYTFNVLFDEKDYGYGKQNKIRKEYGYGQSLIPTQYVIDKKGNIRFESIGFDGRTEHLANEVDYMIELASKPDTTTTKAGETAEGKTNK